MNDGTKKVLIVDDHEDTLRLMERLLNRQGHGVFSADSCVGAQQLADSMGWNIDVFVCDVGLPDGDGADLLASFKNRCGCKTVALTGHGRREDLERYKSQGIDCCLIKPIDLGKLLEVIK